jgi:DNA replicative helicase MCM subunit Mcm2 (Cdc46/Mcm family)
MRQIRITGETNLNLDMVNLAAFPPSKKLFRQLVKYPQDVIPAIDQVLKDLMLDVADADQRAGREGHSDDLLKQIPINLFPFETSSLVRLHSSRHAGCFLQVQHLRADRSCPNHPRKDS